MILSYDANLGRMGFSEGTTSAPCPLYPRKQTSMDVKRCPLWAKSGHRSPYSITSLAAVSSDGGTVRLSAFVVLRLITSSYSVGVCTETSAGTR
jgi:hypothetical protein